VRKWEIYITRANYVGHIFMYLNRNWVQIEMEKGKKNVYQVHVVSGIVSPFSTMSFSAFNIAAAGSVETPLLSLCAEERQKAYFCHCQPHRVPAQWRHN
jgi:hypothetical protein